ncbi:Pentatricopeptide repeat - like 10, partial [Theobroma cacao]
QHSDADLAKAVHACSLKSQEDTHLGNSLVLAYLKLGLLNHSFKVFTFLSCPSVVTYSSLISGFAKSSQGNEAIKLFMKMRNEDVASWNTVISSLVKQGMYEKAFELSGVMQGIGSFRADFFTISTVLSACEGSNALMKGKEVHAHAIRIGLVGNLSVNNALIGFYSKCGSVGDVVALFESMPVRDVITWTEMISAYMEFGLVDFAVEVFDKMPEKNCVSYNALMAGFCRNGEGLKAVKLFIEMVEEGLELTDFSLSSVINACALVMDAKTSEQIHGFRVKFGFRSNACVEAALLDMCMRCGRMADAEKMFCMWPSELDSSVVCTSMVCGYARNGQPDNAISFFLRRRLEGTMDMDDVTLTSVLGVCGTLGFEEMGEQIHCHALKIGFVSDLVVLNSVISMYAKCGNMNGAIKVFNNMPIRDVVSWNALIAGHILHRQGEEALAVWSMMEEADIKADTITLILVILAYRHTNSDLVDNCRKLFLSMKTNYNIEPTPQHYASFVSVLGRWSLLEEAEKMIDKMTAEPKASAWRALLDTGYVPDTSFVLHEVEEHQKKDFLLYHSAKLTTTYGLLMSRPGEPIRIVKNILLCGDCHTFLKFVSVVTRREIFLRDASGFHCFRSGQCSCKNYW